MSWRDIFPPSQRSFMNKLFELAKARNLSVKNLIQEEENSSGKFWGICMNPKCSYIMKVGIDRGHCELCGTNSVKSCSLLIGDFTRLVPDDIEIWIRAVDYDVMDRWGANHLQTIPGSGDFLGGLSFWSEDKYIVVYLIWKKDDAMIFRVHGYRGMDLLNIIECDNYELMSTIEEILEDG